MKRCLGVVVHGPATWERCDKPATLVCFYYPDPLSGWIGRNYRCDEHAPKPGEFLRVAFLLDEDAP